MTKILLDTNFIMLPGTYQINIYEEFRKLFGKYTLLILDKVYDEIKALCNRRIKGAKVSMALLLENDFKLVHVNSSKSPDDLIVEIAEKENCIVGTLDQILKKKLLKLKIKVAILRNRSIIEIHG